MMILDESIKRNLKNHNSIIWLQQKIAGIGFFSNFYSDIQMFTKNDNYLLDKDGVRESHIWKDVEWAKRKFRNNTQGNDPGNIWIKNIDDGKGKILKPQFYSKNEIVERLFSLTAPKKSKKLLITNGNKLKDKSFQISRYKMPILDSKDVFDYKKNPSKSKDTIRSIKIYFKSSEKMQQVKGNRIKLIITFSPCWNLKDYQKKEQIGFREEYETFHKRLEDVWKECFRISYV